MDPLISGVLLALAAIVLTAWWSKQRKGSGPLAPPPPGESWLWGSVPALVGGMKQHGFLEGEPRCSPPTKSGNRPP